MSHFSGLVVLTALAEISGSIELLENSLTFEGARIDILVVNLLGSNTVIRVGTDLPALGTYSAI